MAVTMNEMITQDLTSLIERTSAQDVLLILAQVLRDKCFIEEADLVDQAANI